MGDGGVTREQPSDQSAEGFWAAQAEGVSWARRRSGTSRSAGSTVAR